MTEIRLCVKKKVLPHYRHQFYFFLATFKDDFEATLLYKFKYQYTIIHEPDLVTCIKLNRLQWAGHVQTMEGTGIPKKV
jgi:hypothetical protein